MINRSLEENNGSNIRVVRREFERKTECHVLIRRTTGSTDGCCPVLEVGVGVWESGYARWRREHHVHEFRLQSVIGINVRRRPFIASLLNLLRDTHLFVTFVFSAACLIDIEGSSLDLWGRVISGVSRGVS